MYDNDRCNKQAEISYKIWKDFSVAEFRALKNLVLMLDENAPNEILEDTPESDEALGLRVQMTQYHNDIKSLGEAVKNLPSFHPCT